MRFVRTRTGTVRLEDYALSSWRAFTDVISKLDAAEIRRCLDREYAGKKRRTIILKLTSRLSTFERQSRRAVAELTSAKGSMKPRLNCAELQRRIDAILPTAETKRDWANIVRWTRLFKERQPAEIAALAAASRDRRRHPLPDHEHRDGIPCTYGCPGDSQYPKARI